MKGTVKFFDDRKNYGFIEPEGKGRDHFVHRSDIESGPVKKGDIVEFDSDQGTKDRERLTSKRFELVSPF